MSDNFYAALAEITLKFKRLHEPIINTYACQRCGRRDGLDAVVSDDMWEKISGRGDGGGILCLWCMDELADKRGTGGEITLHFSGRALYGTSDIERLLANRIESYLSMYHDESLSATKTISAIQSYMDDSWQVMNEQEHITLIDSDS